MIAATLVLVLIAVTGSLNVVFIKSRRALASVADVFNIRGKLEFVIFGSARLVKKISGSNDLYRVNLLFNRGRDDAECCICANAG